MKGKSKGHSLALAYDVQRRSKHAEGGQIKDTLENINKSLAKMTKTSGPQIQPLSWTIDKQDAPSHPREVQEQEIMKKSKMMPVKGPRMVQSSVIKSKLRDAHDDMYAEGGKVQSHYDHGQKRGPEGYPKYQEQAQNEKGVHTPVSGVTAFPNSKGTSAAGDYVKDRYAGKPTFAAGKDHPARKEHERVMAESKKIKPKLKGLAEGGEINEEVSMHDAEEDHLEHPAHLEQDNDQMGDEHAMDDHMQMLANGGSVEEEEAIEHAASIAAAIMSKRKKMAEGGEVDLSENAEEEPNNEDQMSFEALKKENYSESEGLDQLDQPEDSNEHSPEHKEEDEDDRSIVGRIRRKMRSRSPITE